MSTDYKKNECTKNEVATNDRFEEAEAFESEMDILDDELLENISSNPVGRLLRIISSLPEIRDEKVTNIRERIDHGEYDASEYLDEALDRVLEEFITEY